MTFITKPTNTEKERALKKVEIAIDKMVDLQDMGFGCEKVARSLEKLNALWGEINGTRTK